MPKQVIHTIKGDMLVREDEAKSFRGVYWALGLLGFSILALLLIFLSGLLRTH